MRACTTPKNLIPTLVKLRLKFNSAQPLTRTRREKEIEPPRSPSTRSLIRFSSCPSLHRTQDGVRASRFENPCTKSKVFIVALILTLVVSCSPAPTPPPLPPTEQPSPTLTASPTPAPTLTSTPVPTLSPSPTPAPRLCSPLAVQPLDKLSEIITQPFKMPRISSNGSYIEDEVSHHGVDLGYYTRDKKLF